MTIFIRQFLFIATFVVGFNFTLMGTAFSANTIEVTERHLYGPGPFPDQKLDVAWIRQLELDGFLNGVVEASNNLASEPNVSGEALQGKIVDGMLSDKTLINENIDMGNAVIMNGQFNLLLAAIYSGPNEGDTFFYTDDDMNWWIKDDIGIDPGFAAGIVKIDNFTFSTKPRIIPTSIQTEKGYPGGIDKIGSTESGRAAIGRLGDDNQDGYLDGTFNAIGQFPMNAIFLPGSPFVQSFGFKSDIAINALEASFLTIANARSFLHLIDSTRETHPKHEDLRVLFDEAVDRTRLALLHLTKAKDKSICADQCAELEPLETMLVTTLNDLKKASPTAKNMRNNIDIVFEGLKKIHNKRAA